MKKYIRNIIFEIMYRFLMVFAGKSYANRQFNPIILFRFLFYQKVLRINAKVKWPVHFTSQVRAFDKIQHGNRNPGMSMGCYIDGRNGIVFGNNVWVGPRVSIISMNHDIKNYKEYIKTDSIIIDDNCWLGANSIILPGVKLGKNIVVAAGAVVTKSFEEGNVILGGNPAKIIKVL